MQQKDVDIRQCVRQWRCGPFSYSYGYNTIYELIIVCTVLNVSIGCLGTGDSLHYVECADGVDIV